MHVPSLLEVARSAPPYWPAGVDSIIRSAADEPVILVPHSNAGLYVPAVVEALGEQVRGVVFIDAALPGAGHYTPPEFLRRPSVGYIWFGEPYDKGATQAAKRGWPTVHLPGGHLHMLKDPDALAATVVEIAGDWL
ncbi:MAG TPA: hypothetical protein VFG00_09715 [Acidothermaceae bacterium]|nr:hypothetical protein [Acidothermaceae bacterium]